MRPLLLLLTLLVPSLGLSKEIIIQNYKFSLPDEYKQIDNDVSDELIFTFEDKIPAFIIGNLRENLFRLEDFEASSRRELFYEIYNEKPSTDKKVLEIRKLNKTFPLQKESISKNNRGWVFFRMDNALDTIGVTFLASSPENDETLKIHFYGETDEKFIKSVIDSLKVK